MSDLLTSRRLVCPFCLEEVTGSRLERKCSSCQQPIPALYLRDARDLEPMAVQAMGWSSHGKSVFLSALALLLTRMQVVWEDYSWAPGSEETKDAIRDGNRRLESGLLPEATTIGIDLPCLIMLRGIERWRGRALVYRDCAGEYFDPLSMPVEKVPFLLKAKTLFLIASPTDLAAKRDRTIDMLLHGFLNTLAEHGIDPSKDRRRLVVVLTKGDLIQDLPGPLRDYLVKDRVWRTLEEGTPGFRFDEPAIDRYLSTMREVDRHLREWIERDAHGRNLVRLATQSGLDLCFSLVSATGGPVREGDSDKRLENRWEPRRVLDPFLWALSFKPPSSSRISSVYPLEPPRSSKGGLIAQWWERFKVWGTQ